MPDRTRGVTISFVLTLSLLAASAGSAQSPRGLCPTPAPRAFVPGEVVEIPDTEAPCRLEVRETGVQLLALEDGSRPDPGIQVRRDGRGRYYSAGAFGFGNIITLWDDRGRFLKSFGREGDGPGEFSDCGMITIFVDGEDRLHVRDGGFRWSVFSPEQEFLGSASASLASFESGAAVLDIGMAVTTSRDGENYFLDRGFGRSCAAGLRDDPTEAAWSACGVGTRHDLLRRRQLLGGADRGLAGRIPARGVGDRWGTPPRLSTHRRLVPAK